MRLDELIDDCPAEVAGTEIAGIAFDTREVKEGSLFFCLRGSKHDGHDFLGEAEWRGAVAAVAEERRDIHKLHLLIVENSRKALALASKRFYGSAADRLTLAAVTGTNGKTTTAHMLGKILRANGFGVGIVGTAGVTIGDSVRPSPLTTPDPPFFHSTLRDIENSGCTHAVTEASAHALALDKLYGTVFAAAGFTNLTRDHLDFFGDMQSYGRAKAKLFTPDMTRCACINISNEGGRALKNVTSVPTIAFGMGEGDVRADDVIFRRGTASFEVSAFGSRERVELDTAGTYNVENALCALSMAIALGIAPSAAARGLNGFKGVAGRFETIACEFGTVIVDFAHTDDGLRNLLNAARAMTEGRLIVVFGCGGDRDRTKRPIMGRVAGELADYVIVTSDNPRSERPESIISDVLAGIKGVKEVDYTVEPDRGRAIELAVNSMRTGDVAVIAGKGAEKYIEAAGVRYPFDDRERAERAIEARKKRC